MHDARPAPTCSPSSSGRPRRRQRTTATAGSGCSHRDGTDRGPRRFAAAPRARAASNRFYDTFIGPRDIVVPPRHRPRRRRNRDPRPGTRGERWRSSLTMRIPAYLRYDVDQRRPTENRSAASVLGASRHGAAVRQGRAGGRARRRLALAAPAAQPGPDRHASVSSRGSAGSAGAAGATSPVCSTTHARATRWPSTAALADPALITLGDDDRLGTSDLVSRLAGRTLAAR